ncbi:hypothetical protein LZ575_01030 [Antarcticibacterium sp. 1MA-6-2]|uniref:hypothetical protein n=1 Tax=Antarcticibacterium sp. 1MA-6-2 TaxID=2908210 RepID=UPI001F3A1024|nr:hypothetical protein [Antarcticibacterium sp. 1MA-6-2]UJH91400.1 hypothetical protein LZ575_01030 [Antarcticibacterium sp. 1MA-6-2]
MQVLIAVLLFSCKNGSDNSPTDTQDTDTITNSQEAENLLSPQIREEIIEKLQGSWRESEYPFRVAHFKDSLVKFIEEGVVEEPVFEEFKVENKCPFNVNNIKTVKPDDIILVMVEAGKCDKLRISNNTLVLSGFSTNTKSDYNIVYEKVE